MFHLNQTMDFPLSIPLLLPVFGVFFSLFWFVDSLSGAQGATSSIVVGGHYDARIAHKPHAVNL